MRRPSFIAEQAREPHGLLGRVIAWIMARETRRENRSAIEALAVGADDHVLDVGCGHGASLAPLAERASRGRVTGADPAALMCEIAERANRALVREGRVAVVRASAERLPLADASIDAVLCVHVAYFWSDLGAALREIARVTRPGGRLAMVVRTSANAATRAFPASVYRFPTLRELGDAARAAGFEAELRGAEDEAHAPVLLVARRSAGRS
jgi:ubiquinone/menaquinone biosynthesis C-methylase UbiE